MGVVAVFVTIVGALIPKRVILRGDDFGYIESVVATIQLGRLTPSEWLEPFNLVLPVMAAGVHTVLGNFWLATLGVSAAIATVNLVLMRAWLRPADLIGEWAILGIALFPVWLNKSVEFTCVPLGIALTLGALLAWRRKRRALFFVLIVIGVANRQSAVCLLALPAVAVFQTLRRERRIDLPLAATGVVVAALALALGQFLPATFAREVATERWHEEFSFGLFTANLMLGLIVLAAVRAGWAALRGEPLLIAWRENLARPYLPLALTLAGAYVVMSGTVDLLFELPGAGNLGPLVILFATFFGAWLSRWAVWPSAEVGGYVLIYVCLVSWRGLWWDYYFLEPALVLAGPALGTTVVTLGRLRRWIVGLMLAVGLGYAVVLSGFLRRADEKTVAYEQALRGQAIAIGEVSDAPFGFLGWKLFAAARARAPGGDGTRLVDFLKFVEGGRARWFDDQLWINREGARRSLHPSGEKWELPTTWSDRRLPLNNAEWREFLSRSERP